MLDPLPAAQPLDAERLMRATAAWIEGATEAAALWDIGAVLSVVADTAGTALAAEVPAHLPDDRPPPFDPRESATLTS